jgi:1-acyl-sn-glycerol-3-phosphate acyltransferase
MELAKVKGFAWALADTGVTLVLWGYFSLGYLLAYLPRHLAARLLAADGERAFQRINSRFYRGFFWLARRLIPGLRIEVPEEVRRLRGTVIVSNHASYLDPLLLMALFERHKTIVKGRFFDLPLFGWVLRHAGYLPTGAKDGARGAELLRQVERMPAFLAAGGNLFVFPEGTRRPDGRLGPFGSGAFHIARRGRAPVALLYIQGTAALFQPGRWRFAAGARPVLRIALVDRLQPQEPHGHPPAPKLRDLAWQRLSAHAAAFTAPGPPAGARRGLA